MMIKRMKYLNILTDFKDIDVIKVITGIRSCGKSTLLEQYIVYLKEHGISDESIIHINLEDTNSDLKDYKDLYEYIKLKIHDSKKYYVFLDEVQNVPEFQKAVNSLYIKKNIDLYITCLNPSLSTYKLATLFPGRYIEIKMLPLSFKEFVSAFDNKNYQELFLNYMKIGGMPGTVSIASNNINNAYIYGWNFFYDCI